MGVCAVCNCKSNNEKKGSEKTSFHTFPKEKRLLRKWTNFCKRKDIFNIKTARICSLHFVPDCFENNLQYESGFVRHRKLKANAIPTLFSISEPVATSSRSTRMAEKQSKQLVADLLQQNEDPFHDEELNDPGKNACEDRSDNLLSFDKKDNAVVLDTRQHEEFKKLSEEMTIMRKKMTDLEKENFLLKQSEKGLKKELESLKLEHRKTIYEIDNVEKKLKEIFTDGQIKKLKNPEKKFNWAEKDIEKAITLYSASSRAYKLLKKKQFPLPAVRTLQWWAKKNNLSPGIKKL